MAWTESTFREVSSVTTDTLARVASSVLVDAEVLARTLVDAIATELPELAADARVRELFECTVLDNVVSALRVISGRSEDVEPVAPPVALEFARRLAQRGVPLTLMLRAYRLGQAMFQQHMIARIAEEDVSVGEVASGSMALSSFVFMFIDGVSEQVVSAYQLEWDDWLRHRNASRLAKVRAVLNGRLTERADVDRTLGFAVAASHVGAVLWCGNDMDDTGDADRFAQLERHAATLESALGASPRSSLLVSPDALTLWAWIPAATVDADGVGKAMGGAVEEIHAALGQPAAGLDGFRATHRQALQAQALALAADPAHRMPVIAASQLGPLALVASEIAGVRAWVQDVLGGLAVDDENTARLRETVWSYLSSGSSLNTAAGELHLHKNSIQYRIRKAEDARGRSLSEGRIDVEVALLACRILGATVLRSPDPGR
ncbi:MAG: hypothetical protein GEU97_14155 [Actinophytocola sp.]|nr:hypothetical protein [Actinophytocola sp.]